MSASNSSISKSWRRLRFSVALEGGTLLALALVATPLKHLANMPFATKFMGPVHGLAFLFFLYVLVESFAAGMLQKRAALRLFIGSMIPFGGLVNERWLARQMGADG